MTGLDPPKLCCAKGSISVRVAHAVPVLNQLAKRSQPAKVPERIAVRCVPVQSPGELTCCSNLLGTNSEHHGPQPSDCPLWLCAADCQRKSPQLQSHLAVVSCHQIPPWRPCAAPRAGRACTRRRPAPAFLSAAAGCLAAPRAAFDAMRAPVEGGHALFLDLGKESIPKPGHSRHGRVHTQVRSIACTETSLAAFAQQ